MWSRGQFRFVTFVVTIGFVSALICQSHMALAPDVSSHHITLQDTASHHGTHQENDAQNDLCCFTHVADRKIQDLTLSAPQVAGVVFSETEIVHGPMVLTIPTRVLTLKPPGSCSPLRQSCALLI
jgi:hypothetical protein